MKKRLFGIALCALAFQGAFGAIAHDVPRHKPKPPVVTDLNVATPGESLIEAYDRKRTERELIATAKAMDLDRDGRVSYDEFFYYESRYGRSLLGLPMPTKLVDCDIHADQDSPYPCNGSVRYQSTRTVFDFLAKRSGYLDSVQINRVTEATDAVMLVLGRGRYAPKPVVIIKE